jgi:hypothetical protein
MNHLAIFLTFCILLMSPLYAENSSSKQNFTCKITGGVTVDSLFRAIPADRISLEPEGQKAQPAVLDRKNGYLNISYKAHDQTIEYAAALYTGGQKNEKIFLLVTRYVGYIASLPSTEGFWIFEYSAGKCIEETDAILSPRHAWSKIKLPRFGTDLVCCEMKGDDRGLRDECTTFIWDMRKAKFIKK